MAYKTEKRPAKVGEKILITEPFFPDDSWYYSKGDVFTVNRELEASALSDVLKTFILYDEGDVEVAEITGDYIAVEEYEVIIGEEK